MKSVLFVQDKNLAGEDYFRCDDSFINIDNPNRNKIFTKLAYPSGLHIFRSKKLNIYISLRSVNIHTYLSDGSRDIKNRLVPIMFFSKFKNPLDVYDEFIKHLTIYEDTVNQDILEQIKKCLKKMNIWMKVCPIVLVLAVIISVIILAF